MLNIVLAATPVLFLAAVIAAVVTPILIQVVVIRVAETAVAAVIDL